MALRGCGRGARPALAALALLWCAGCGSGVRWRLDDFKAVHAESIREGKLTLVYFRSWTSVECTRVEDRVFNTPAAAEATRDMNCAMYELTWDRPLAQSLGVSDVPAFVILDVDRSVLAGDSGEFTLERFLESVTKARSERMPVAPGEPPPRDAP